DDVGREVVLILEEGRTDAVGVYRHAQLLEATDLFRVEAAGHHDLDVLEAGVVQGGADVPHELRVHAPRIEAAHLRDDRAIDHGLGRVDPHAVQARPERTRDGQGRTHAVVVEVDEAHDLHRFRHRLGEGEARLHGVAAVGR